MLMKLLTSVLEMLFMYLCPHLKRRQTSDFSMFVQSVVVNNSAAAPFINIDMQNMIHI